MLFPGPWAGSTTRERITWIPERDSCNTSPWPKANQECEWINMPEIVIRWFFPQSLRPSVDCIILLIYHLAKIFMVVLLIYEEITRSPTILIYLGNGFYWLGSALTWSIHPCFLPWLLKVIMLSFQPNFFKESHLSEEITKTFHASSLPDGWVASIRSTIPEVQRNHYFKVLASCSIASPVTACGIRAKLESKAIAITLLHQGPQ